MTFYVRLVLTFMSKMKIEYVVLQNPRIFAFFFTIMIILLNILRAKMLVYGQVLVNTLAFVSLLSTPKAIVEGYGILQTIEKTLKQNNHENPSWNLLTFLHSRNHRSWLCAPLNGNNLR